jgi:hypothetical protein
MSPLEISRSGPMAGDAGIDAWLEAHGGSEREIGVWRDLGDAATKVLSARRGPIELRDLALHEILAGLGHDDFHCHVEPFLRDTGAYSSALTMNPASTSRVAEVT